MNEIKILEPTSLSFITTHKCTSACPNCCFNCSPTPLNKRMMSFDEMKNYISQVKANFPQIKIIVFTGGECTLLKEDLFRAIEYASQEGFATRIVTNGFWAKNEQSANDMLNSLANAGLTEINFSTGDEHSRFVSLETLSRAVILSAKRPEFSSVCINIEESEGHIINKKYFASLPQIKSMPTEFKKKIICLQSTWIHFRDSETTTCSNGIKDPNKINVDSNKGCAAILDSVNLNPNGQFLSCCGLASEYSSFLKLGDAHKNSLLSLHRKRFDDIMKLWLYTSGPQTILRKIGVEIQDPHRHMCEYCLQLFTNKDNIQRLLNIDQKTINNILLDYYLKTSQL